MGTAYGREPPLPTGSQRLQRSGYVCLFTDEAAALTRLDQLARGCIVAEAIEDWQVPSLIDEEDLVKCGYISAFPSQLTAAATVDNGSHARVVDSRCVTSEDLCHHHKHLTPAACLNIYPMMGLRPTIENRVVTTLATVYRYEPQGFHDLIRLWEFKVREFVFAGTRDYVTTMIEDASRAAGELAGQLGIESNLVNASDHFYPSYKNTVRQQLQMQLTLKRELATRIDGQEVSLASFNLHGTHFSVPYGFDNNNSIVTGCVGFGLHRLLAACRGSVTLRD
jgi:seryl-tRNA synthetase